MKITAQSANSAQEIIRFTTNHDTHGGYWSAVRLVGWITQNKSQNKTTLFYKWQRACEKNNPYWKTSHAYTVSLGGQTSTVNFALGTATTTWEDLCSAQSITVTHASDGTFSGTLSASGYKYWESASGSVSVEFPAFSATPAPEPPSPPAPIVVDDSPYFSIYADGTLLYRNGLEDADGNRPFELINPKLVLEVNKSGSLTFDIPITNERYRDLQKLKTNIEVRQGNEVLFRGRIINDKRNFYNTKTVYCEGCLSYLYDSVQKPFTFNGSAYDLMDGLFSAHNAQMTANRQLSFVYSDITQAVNLESSGYRKTLDIITKDILGTLGGYLVPYYGEQTGFQWLSSYGETTSQVIQFGENLTDFSEYIDASKVFTAVIPIGKDGLTVTGDYIEDPTAVSVFGRIIEVVEFPEITTEAELIKAGTAYLRTGIESATTITIGAVDMHLIDPEKDRIRLGDTIRAVSVPHSLDSFFMVTRMSLDLQDASNNVYTFGYIPEGITDLQTKTIASRYVISED